MTGAANPSSNIIPPNTARPVEQVTWYDAVEFCNKLSALESLEPVYTIANRVPVSATEYPITAATVTMDMTKTGYRLPTEAEWMWAAMGATSGYGYTSGIYTSGWSRLFAGSTGTNGIGDYAWTYENSEALGSLDAGYGTHVGGSKLKNELELADMSGNVMEWCWDWYGTYPSGGSSEYTGTISGSYRIIRGGGWGYAVTLATVSNRYNLLPESYDKYSGFRIVKR